MASKCWVIKNEDAAVLCVSTIHWSYSLGQSMETENEVTGLAQEKTLNGARTVSKFLFSLCDKTTRSVPRSGQ
jgi:hypothetical protein